MGNDRKLCSPRTWGNTSPSLKVFHVFDSVRCQLLPSGKLKYAFLIAISIDPSQTRCASFLHCLCIEQSTETLGSCSATHTHCGFLVTPELLRASAWGSVRWEYKCFFSGALLRFSNPSGTKHRKSSPFSLYTCK